MCEQHGPTTLTRRAALALGAAGAAALIAGCGRQSGEAFVPAADPVTLLPGLSVWPRAAWGGDLLPRGPLEREDVRFLLVHHSATTNAYSAASVPATLRDVYAFHTGPAKGWPDVCYNFFVDRFGGVWEGRTGSIMEPVVASATGGSQGFAQLVCLLGDFTAELPTPGAMRSLTLLLTWLGGHSALDTRPGATATFVSRGSQPWAAGKVVTTATIAGHRDMSFTGCPGDLLYPGAQPAPRCHHPGAPAPGGGSGHRRGAVRPGRPCDASCPGAAARLRLSSWCTEARLPVAEPQIHDL